MWPFSKKQTEDAKTKKRTAPTLKTRSFAAGSIGDRLNASWSSSAQSPDQLIYQNLATLRARSREQVCNNDYAKRFISLVKTNVIGKNGISIQSKVEGFDGKPDRPAQNAIEAALSDWSKSKNCDFKESLSFVEINNLAIGTIATDGEVIIRQRTSGKYLYQLELIDPALLDVNHNTKLQSGNVIRFGIEYNAQGRRVAYHLTDNSKGADSDIYYTNYEKKVYIRVDAKEIIHLFITDFIDQKRGIPWMSTALQRMKMVIGFEDASLVNARAGASKMGFYTSEGGEEYRGEDGEGEDGELYESFEAGTMTKLPEGVGFQSFNPEYPSGEFAAFMKTCLRGISSGLNVSYNTLGNDLEGVNFSSMRHGAVEEREIWKCLQDWLIEKMVRPVFEEWISRCWELELISIPSKNGSSKPLSRDLDSYLKASFQPRRWDWVDPLKDIQARRQEIELGITSVSAIIREKGLDPETVWADIEKDREILNKLGLTLEGGANEKPSNEDKQQASSEELDPQEGSD